MWLEVEGHIVALKKMFDPILGFNECILCEINV